MAVDPLHVFALGDRDCPTSSTSAVNGWVAVDAVPADVVAELPRWVDEVSAIPDGERGVLQHFEGTDAGPIICRSENFVPVHEGLRALLCTGALLEVAGALLGEPAVLYKEKVNYKLAGGAGYSPHQDAPAYPLIDTHVSAMVAIDDAGEGNGCLEVVSGCFDEVLPLDERGCIRADVAADARLDAGPGASGTDPLVPQPHAAPQRREHLRAAPPSAVPHVQRGTGRRPPRRVLRGEARGVRVGPRRATVRASP